VSFLWAEVQPVPNFVLVQELIQLIKLWHKENEKTRLKLSEERKILNQVQDDAGKHKVRG